DHADEIRKSFARRWTQRLLEIVARCRLEERHLSLSRSGCEHVDRGIADAALGNGDRSPKRFFVARIGDQLQVRHQIADLPAIIEAHRPDETIGNGLTAQRVLDGAALRVRAIQHREVAEAAIAGVPPRLYLLENEVGFVALVESSNEG